MPVGFVDLFAVGLDAWKAIKPTMTELSISNAKMTTEPMSTELVDIFTRKGVGRKSRSVLSTNATHRVLMKWAARNRNLTVGTDQEQEDL